MALFGNSFKELLMAEAMLEEDYRSSHENICNLYQEDGTKSSLMKQKENSKNGITENLVASPSALKRKRSLNKSKDNDTQEVCDLRREVVIQLPPPKRPRIGGNYSAADIVQALNMAMSPEERKEALENAVGTFDHDDRTRHDHEIAVGADVALVKALVYLEFASGFRREPIRADMNVITKEIAMVLTALECVYRASSDSVAESFNRVGKDLLHILVILIDDEVKQRLQEFTDLKENREDDNDSSSKHRDDDTNIHSVEVQKNIRNSNQRPVTPPSPAYARASVEGYDRDVMLRKATKCVGHFARIGKATKPIAHFPGFLGSALNLINLRPFHAVPFESRLSCLWTIANLACNTENMTMMSCTPNLLNSLASICRRQAAPGDSLETIMEVLRAKSISSRALLNLSWAPANKVLMADSSGLLETLTGLALERRAPYRSSKTMHDIMLKTRRNSIGALRNIAAAPRRSKIALCGFKDGKLLDTMTDVALNEVDQHAIDLAVACIHNLAITDTAKAMVDRPALVLALKNISLEDENNEGSQQILAEGSVNNSRKSHASSVILVLERSITPEMPCYENLRELLDAVNPSNPGSTDGEERRNNNNVASEAINATAV